MFFFYTLNIGRCFTHFHTHLNCIEKPLKSSSLWHRSMTAPLNSLSTHLLSSLVIGDQHVLNPSLPFSLFFFLLPQCAVWLLHLRNLNSVLAFDPYFLTSLPSSFFQIIAQRAGETQVRTHLHLRLLPALASVCRTKPIQTRVRGSMFFFPLPSPLIPKRWIKSNSRHHPFRDLIS